MAANDGEFEVVVGYKLLLSIFFLMVFLFGLFFTFGYSVGYDRGQTDQDGALATVQPMEQPSGSVRMPDALLKDVPEVPARPGILPATEATESVQQPQGATVPKSDRVSAGGPATTPKPSAAGSDKPRPFRDSKPPASVPKPKPAPSAPASTTVSGAAVARSIHLQVAAIRVRSDAQMLVRQLKAKGYPTTLFERPGDEWHRVLVGPFNSESAAKESQKKLTADGLDSILRKP